MLNPAPSIQELHLTFVIWKKLQSPNKGSSFKDSYYFQLLEYDNKCQNGIPRNQIGRIHDVRKVRDSKTYGHYFSYRDGKELTYIRSGLPINDEEMEIFEGLFNQYSKELRQKIHIDGIEPKAFVKKQLDSVTELKKAEISLLTSGNLIAAKKQYKQISNLAEKTRVINLENLLFDNLSLEQLVGSTIIELAEKSTEFYDAFLKQFEQDTTHANIEIKSRYAEISYGLNPAKKDWEYNFAKVKEILTSTKELRDPYLSAHLMQNLIKDRKTIYSPKVISLLKR